LRRYDGWYDRRFDWRHNGWNDRRFDWRHNGWNDRRLDWRHDGWNDRRYDRRLDWRHDGWNNRRYVVKGTPLHKARSPIIETLRIRITQIIIHTVDYERIGTILIL
jgi:hypothetical protein